MPAEVTAPSNPVTWAQIFEAWKDVEADFQEVYGIDLEARIRTCSWRWFAIRCIGLLSTDTRLNRRYAPEPTT
ncbi:hypothetical protein CQ044_16495 [Microbacterium sp. MYb64]|nr:hypothetical protein CQ044_16495 [Microbacterium sp. MYb64]